MYSVNIDNNVVKKGLDTITKLYPNHLTKVSLQYDVNNDVYHFEVHGLRRFKHKKTKELLGDSTNIVISDYKFFDKNSEESALRISDYMWNGVELCLDTVYNVTELEKGKFYKYEYEDVGYNHIVYCKFKDYSMWGNKTKIAMRRYVKVYLDGECCGFYEDSRRLDIGPELNRPYVEISEEEYNEIESEYKEFRREGCCNCECDDELVMGMRFSFGRYGYGFTK